MPQSRWSAWCSRFGLVSLPEQFHAFDNPVIIGACPRDAPRIEFVADKVPWADTAWDAVHTVIRPARWCAGGGGRHWALPRRQPRRLPQSLAGTVAMTTHLTKAGTRAVVEYSLRSHSPTGGSVLAEDVFVDGADLVCAPAPSRRGVDRGRRAAGRRSSPLRRPLS